MQYLSRVTSHYSYFGSTFFIVLALAFPGGGFFVYKKVFYFLLGLLKKNVLSS